MGESPTAPRASDAPERPVVPHPVASAPSSSVAPKRVSRRAPFQPTSKRRRAGASLRPIADAVVSPSPRGETKREIEPVVLRPRLGNAIKVEERKELDAKPLGLNEVSKTEPLVNGAPAHGASLRGRPRPAVPAVATAAAQTSASLDAGDGQRDKQARRLSIKPFQPRPNRSLKQNEPVLPRPSTPAVFQAASTSRHHPFEPPTASSASRPTPPSQPNNTPFNAVESHQVASPNLPKRDIPTHDETHGHTMPSKRTRTPSPPVPRKRPRPLLHNASDTSLTSQPHPSVAHSSATLPWQPPSRSCPSANAPSPPTPKPYQRRLSPPPPAAHLRQNSQPNVTYMPSPLRPRARSSSPPPYISSEKSPLRPNFKPHPTSQRSSPTRSPLFGHHHHQPPPPRAFSPPLPPRRRSRSPGIVPMGRSPARRRSPSLSPLRNTSSRIQSPIARRERPGSSHTTPPHRFHSPPLLRHSRRSRTPPPRRRFSRSPQPHRRWSRSSSPRRRSSFASSPSRRYSRSPMQRGRTLRSPPPRFRRSRSPPARNRRSPSPPHRRRCSFSPRHRTRPSPSVSYRSRRSPSPPHRRRESLSPIRHRRRSRSPPPPAPIRPHPSRRSRTPSRSVRRPELRSPLGQRPRPVVGLENPSPIVRNARSPLPLAPAFAEGSDSRQNSAQFPMEKTDARAQPEEKRPTKSLRTMTKPDATARSNSINLAQDRSKRRFEPIPRPAWLTQQVDSSHSKKQEAASKIETAKPQVCRSVPSTQPQAPTNVVKSSTKASVNQAQTSTSDAPRNIAMDLVPSKSAISGSGTSLKDGEVVSGTRTNLVPRPPPSKGPSRPPLVPFDPFGPALPTVDQGKSQEQNISKPSERTEEPNVEKEKGTNAPDEPKIVEYLTDYGLHIIARDPLDLKVTWLGCKFCPLFGCSGRHQSYLMVFQRPFCTKTFSRHLSSSHTREWTTYRHAPKEAKSRFFEGRTLPSPLLFSLRIVQLKHGNTMYGEKTLEEHRIQNLPREVKTKRQNEYRSIADREAAAENECRLTELEKSVPVGFEAEIMRAKIDPTVQTGVQFITRGEEYSRTPKFRKPQNVQDKFNYAGQGEILHPAEVTGVRLGRGTKVRCFARKVVTGSEKKVEQRRPLGTSFLEGEDCLFNNEDVFFDFNDPERKAGRLSENVSSEDLESNSVRRIPRMKGIRNRFRSLQRWPTMFKYDFFFDVKDDISELVLGGALSLRETPSQSTAEKILLFGNQPEVDLNDHASEPCEKHSESLNVSGLVLFYLLRGICISVIPGLVKEISQSTMIKLVPDDESVESLVRSIGDSIVVTGLRLTRSLSESHITAWGFALRTRVCLELDGIEILMSMHLKDWRLLTTHVVSVRGARGAADVVSKILDCICEDWRVRVMGIASEVPATNRKAKKMERIFFEELQEIDGVDTNVLLVDADLPKGARPVYVGVLLDMSGEEFDNLLEHHRNRLRHWYGDDVELKKLKAQRSILAALYKKPSPKPQEWNTTCGSWPTSRKILPLMKFAQVLSALWKQNGQPPTGCTEVGKVLDCEKKECVSLVCPSIERIYWARTLINLIQDKKACFSSMCLEPLGSQWASNWSNWETTPSQRR